MIPCILCGVYVDRLHAKTSSYRNVEACYEDLIHGAFFLLLGFFESDQEVPWISLVCSQSDRNGVSCGIETEFSNATTAYRLDANSHQVSGVWWVNQRAQEFNFSSRQHLLVIPVLRQGR